MVNNLEIYKKKEENIVVNITTNIKSSKNTTFTSTRVTDGQSLDLSKVTVGMKVSAEGGSTGVITVVNDGSDFVDVSSWIGGTPSTGEIVIFKDVPLNITGYTIYFYVKTNRSVVDLSATISKTITSHTIPTFGKTIIDLSSSDTNVTAGDYIYGIEMKDGSDNMTVLVEGHLTVSLPSRLG